MPRENALSFMLFFGLICFNSTFAQDLKQMALHKFQFTEHTLPVDGDTVHFYLHQKAGSSPSKIVMYLQGTSPIPGSFFGVDKREKGYAYYQYFSADYEQLDDSYAFVIVGLPGVPVVENAGHLLLDKYNRLNSLDYRVLCADTVLDHLTTQLFRAEKVIVYGHSEGAPVAAKLATVNSRITHLGFWGGNALPDFYDFILFERKANLAGEQSDSLTEQNIAAHLELFEHVAADPDNTIPANTNEITEYTNKRWWSYAEPPINHLLKIDIPLFVQAATHDESAPIESNYLIPLEFIRLGKKNLTFKICQGCDHGFVNLQTEEDHWTEIFRDFIQWTEQE